ncbi:hypothetical protein F7P84_06960 [Edwardsiella anguillarum]|uniref:Uncharacterized protein n=1 Tax=Edwardsiella anguillarum ET080813 TaxID=667120 RepID=A0A076LU66_9GAMM|nr:Hypothetical protein ETEE_3832 [Edwardsiella anguillarum ET080813]KAB0592091.1 hypothetical protein F7P84_06960 [Edwardsiella anguillarum]RFT05395.1 hypothetical protein CGL57_00560 [Edwardsiella anguillarum]
MRQVLCARAIKIANMNPIGYLFNSLRFYLSNETKIAVHIPFLPLPSEISVFSIFYRLAIVIVIN